MTHRALFPLCAAMSLFLVAASGCSHSDIYPVSGKVVFSDGRPVDALHGGIVVFEAPEGKGSSRGVIAADGSFRLSTAKTDDGAFAGKNRVCVSPPRASIDAETRKPMVLDAKFMQFDTSGLEIVVEPRSNTDVLITVDAVKNQ